MVIFPKEYNLLFRDTLKPACTILMISIFSIHWILKKKVKWHFYDLVFLGLVALHFLSYLWADFSYAIWASAFDTLFLFLLYFTVKHNWQYANKSVFAKLAFGVILINLFSLTLFWVQVFMDEGLLIYGQSKKLAPYFGDNDNYLASLFCIVSPLFVFIRSKTKLNKLLLILLFSLHFIILILFQSRGALVSFLFIWIGYSISIKEQLRKLLLPISLILSLISFLFVLNFSEPAHFLKKLSPMDSFNESSADERILIWQKTAQLISEKPILGHGVNQFKYTFPSTNMSDFAHSFNSHRYYTHAHNFFIEKTFELGIIGCFIWLFIFTLPIFYWLKNNKKCSIIWSFIILGFVGSSFFYGVIYYTPFKFQVLLNFTFLSIGVIHSKQGVGKSIAPIFSSCLNIILLLSSLTLLSYFGTQYSNGIYFKEAQLLRKAKRFKEAGIVLNNMTIPIWSKAYRGNSIEFLKGENMWRIKKNEPAITQMEKGIADDPYNVNRNMRLGNLYYSKERYPEAKDKYERIISMNNNFFKAQLMLARIAKINDDHESFDRHLAHVENAIAPLFRTFYSEQVWYRAPKKGIIAWTKYCKIIDEVNALRELGQQSFK